ncbi:hypothetical protein NDU88_009848 [Pleurodeles waltl]|uniref:Uncharacterized protein n=1 Tax=Pleurodeles waltl TaxID=8319 RepID=A0AAV7PW43_PLEWA|nr:hypothetical protein NDU88_009848 [Pleurodeles waltl]
MPQLQSATHHTTGQMGQNIDQEARDPSRAELLQAKQGSRQVLENKIETVAIEINLLCTDRLKVSDKVRIAEGSIEKPQMEVATLKKHMVAAEARVEDAEGRACRNNVRLLGFPELAEGARTKQFVEAWIRDTLKPEGLPPMFAVEKAPPRAIIACMLNYKDSDSVLKVARDMDNDMFEIQKISIYPDNTTKEQAPRKTC